MNNIKVDLHCHSTASDGILTPSQIVERAHSRNVSVLALTDHDTLDGLIEASEAAKKFNIKFIPGIELSTSYKGETIHLLGFFTDDQYKNEELVSFLKTLKQKRRERALLIAEKLDKYFSIKIDVDKMIASASGVVARPHIAKAIRAAGYDYSFDYIFDNFIGDDCPAYVPNEKIDTPDGISFLKKYGCIVILAHPVLIKKNKVEDFLDMGLDGLEAYYYINTKSETLNLIGLCRTHNMISSCGSDYHGIDVSDEKHGDLGDVYMPEEDREKFLLQFKI